MTLFTSRVARVCQPLNDVGAHYLLVGATAMQLWGTTRATQDIDILIDPSLENTQRVLAGLATLGFGMAAALNPADVASRPVTMIGDVPNVDVLTRAWNVVWAKAHTRAHTFEVEGVKIPTASIEDLIASKRTGRLQDAADIEMLEAIRHFRSNG